MRTMQDKILIEIERILKAAGLDPAIQRQYANLGTIFGQVGFSTGVEVAFDFQAKVCTLGIAGPGVDALDLADNPPVYRYEAKRSDRPRNAVKFYALDYNDGARIGAFRKLLGQAAAAGKRAAHSESVRAGTATAR